ADPNDQDCISKVRAKFDGTPDLSRGCFEKLESKSPNDCVTFDDTFAAELVVADCIDAIVSTIDPGGVTQSRSGAGKKKWAAKKLKSILKCYQTAKTPGKDPNPNPGGCIDKAIAKFDGSGDPLKSCFGKLENKAGNDCQPPAGNEYTVEALVDGSS